MPTRPLPSAVLLGMALAGIIEYIVYLIWPSPQLHTALQISGFVFVVVAFVNMLLLAIRPTRKD